MRLLSQQYNLQLTVTVLLTYTLTFDCVDVKSILLIIFSYENQELKGGSLYSHGNIEKFIFILWSFFNHSYAHIIVFYKDLYYYVVFVIGKWELLNHDFISQSGRSKFYNF